MGATHALVKYGANAKDMQLMLAKDQMESSDEEEQDPLSKLNPEELRKL